MLQPVLFLHEHIFVEIIYNLERLSALQHLLLRPLSLIASLLLYSLCQSSPPLSPSVVPATFYQSSMRAWQRPSNLAPCRNLCERVAVRGHNGSLYDKGMKYCPRCAIFFRSDEKTHCFCCGKKLRIRTRNSRTRNRNRCSKCNRKLINFSWHDNDEEYSLICRTCATVQKIKGIHISLSVAQHCHVDIPIFSYLWQQIQNSLLSYSSMNHF